MPLLPPITHPTGTRLHWWRDADENGNLPPAATPGNRKRDKEHAAERMLVEAAFGKQAELRHGAHGEPFIASAADGSVICPRGHVSVSHTRGVVCLATDSQHTIGIDTERITPRTVKVRSKFLGEDEASLISDSDAQANTIAWTAKEAMYKAALMPGIGLRGSLVITSTPQAGHPYSGMAVCGGKTLKMTLSTSITGQLVTTLATVVE